MASIFNGPDGATNDAPYFLKHFFGKFFTVRMDFSFFFVPETSMFPNFVKIQNMFLDIWDKGGATNDAHYSLKHFFG